MINKKSNKLKEYLTNVLIYDNKVMSNNRI